MMILRIIERSKGGAAEVNYHEEKIMHSDKLILD